MKKKNIVLMIMILLLAIPSIIFAFDPGIGNPSPSVPSDIGTLAKKFLGAIQWIGYAIAIGMLIYIGVKYVMSAANEKANMKQALINYIIGALIIAIVSTLFGWIVTFFQEVNGGGGGENPTTPGASTSVPDTQPDHEHMWD